MNISVFWYSYLFFIRKLYKKRNKENSINIKIFSLVFLFIIILFFISLFTYLFDVKIIRKIFSSGVPIGPLAGIIAIVIISLYYVIARPKINDKIISKMKKSYLIMENIQRKWAMFFVIVIFFLFFSAIILIALTKG